MDKRSQLDSEFPAWFGRPPAPKSRARKTILAYVLAILGGLGLGTLSFYILRKIGF
jgi:hypothetical protein